VLLILIIDVCVSKLVQPINGEPTNIIIFFKEVTCFVDVVEINLVDGNTVKRCIFCFFLRVNKQIRLIFNGSLKALSILITND
jgi:hypothetical protein